MKRVSLLLLLCVTPTWAVNAQDARVDVGKHARPIPRVCESVIPASIPPAGQIDIPALVKEAICKGAGDMLGEYTYVVNASRRQKDKKGKTKEETITYEVFIPTLKSGTKTRGVLVVTSRNGVPVLSKELEKDRSQAAERIEKEETKIARATPSLPADAQDSKKGLLPLGMYTQTAISKSTFGVKRGGVALGINDFLRTGDLSLARREENGGRDTLIFNFVPRPAAHFDESKSYMAQLRGEIWIDVQDRIVTRLIGWSSSASTPVENKSTKDAVQTRSLGETPPAVLVEMARLIPQGVWLPRVIRINGADYPTLFDGITTDYTSTYSNYIRFSTEVKDASLEPPSKP